MTVRLDDHCGAILADMAERDERICVLDGDLADSDGAAPFARRHPGRFLMAGIAEQAMVSVAAGMASCGQRPWVFSFAAFLCYRAYDQIRMCLSHARQPVTLVGSHSGGCAGRNGRSHAALNDLALMTSLPAMTVWAPADRHDLTVAMQSIADGDTAAYLRLPRSPVPDLPPGRGVCRWLTEPAPIAVLSTGLGTQIGWAAVRELARRGHRVGLLNCPLIAPLPRAKLADLVVDVERLIVVEDHHPTGGLATAVATQLGVDLTAFGWPAHWAGQSGDDASLLAAHRLDAAGLADRITHAMTIDPIRSMLLS